MDRKLILKVPREFNRLCQFFNQDVMIIFTSMEGAVAASVLSLTKTERPIVHTFLEKVLESNLSGKEIEELWRQSPAQISFFDSGGFLHMLELLRDALSTQLMLDAKECG
jgi:hypothetical protein